METLTKLLAGLGVESLIKLGVIILDAAHAIATAEGMSAEEFTARRTAIEKERASAVDQALADLRGMLKS